MADWGTVASLATAECTLVLAIATFASVGWEPLGAARRGLDEDRA